MRLAIACASILLVGCATDLPAPEPRTTVVTVKVPTPVPCLKPEDIPKVPTPTPVDAANATTDQLAAAAAADLMALDLYAKTADPLLQACSKLTPEVKP
jgi:hypothetical protein